MSKTNKNKANKEELLKELLPQFESFIEVRENYIKALEQTIDVLRSENKQFNRNNIAIRNSIDELVAMQQLSNVVSITSEPEKIVETLVELTKQVIDVVDANVYLYNDGSNRLEPLANGSHAHLDNETMQQFEAGVIDWVVAEKRTIVIPDLEYMVADKAPRSFVIVPLIIRKKPIGIYIINTEMPRDDFSNHHIQLLTLLATQAAVGVANWQAHQQLMKANDEIKSSRSQMIQTAKLAAIGELAAGILHEIKNPLQIIMMHLDMVRRGRAMENWNDLVLQQIKRLNEITKRLMNFSRSASEDLPLENVDVNKAADEVIALVNHDFEREKVIIEKKFDENLPPARANINFLQQVFLNMLLNARDAMPSGGAITITTITRKNRIAIAIADTGVGIPRDQLIEIFQPFFTTKERGKGTGLGLSISNKIVSQFGGEIKVSSKVGKGTKFTILLPIGSIEE